VAIDHLACPEASVVGVIGFGRQGWLQIEAALSVRTIRTVKVYRRDLEALAVSANQAGRAWNVDCVAVADAEEAVRMADIVITATHSPYPVFKASWLKPGAHINALGPKYVGRTELGSDVVARADLLVSDFPEQYRSEPLFILQGTPHMERLQDLAWTLQNSRRKEAGSERVTLFLSHGLAGTEILLLKALYDKALKTGQGTRIGLGTREELPGPPCLGQE
jgi:ornithine cyclodeaminase